MITDVRNATASRLSADTITQLLNQAHRQILENYPWSFLLTNAVISGATPKTAGTITVAQGSAIVQGVDTAFGLEDTGSFLWVSDLGLTPIPVQSVQGTAVLTLSYPWGGPTQIGTSYVLEPLYYIVDGALEVYAIKANGILLTPRTREYINDIDPTRESVGANPCTDWCSAPASPNGSVCVELWPPSGGFMPYLVDFKRQAPLLVNPFDKPLCPYQIVEEKAMEMGCLQMLANTASQVWLGLADRHKQTYMEALEDAKAEDGRRVKDRNGVSAQPSYIGSDANYVPTHDQVY